MSSSTFAEIVEQYNISIAPDDNHHRRPGWEQLCCPYCDDGSERWHLGFNLSYGNFTCWQCGPHNRVNMLAELTGLTRRQAFELTDDLQFDEAPERKRGKLILPKGIGKLLDCHKNYLQGRQYKYKALRRLWRIQGLGYDSEIPWRIFIPIHYHGEVVSWTTRSIQDNGLRWLSASMEQESIPHKSILYGADYCRHVVIVHEGPTDVWRTGPGAAATCGTGFSTAQVLSISKYMRRVICFDSSLPAQRRANDLAQTLATFPGETYNVQLDAEDPGAASKKEVKRLRKFLD